MAANDPSPRTSSSTATIVVKRKKLRQGAMGVRKVKTGCLTCKIRHKKCDELLPACTPCSSTGRKCEFLKDHTLSSLVKVNQNSLQHEQAQERNASSSLSQIHTSIYQPILAFQLQKRDEMHFEYFRHVGISEFGVYYSDGEDSKGGAPRFWESLLWRTVCEEPFVLHAVLALAAFGRERYHPSSSSDYFGSERGSGSDGVVRVNDGYPVERYNTAIRLLNQRIGYFAGFSSGVNKDKYLELAVLGTHLFIAVEMFWSRIPRVEGLLAGVCGVLKGSERTKRYFHGSLIGGGEVGWEGFRCYGDGDENGNMVGGRYSLERLLIGLASVARQIAWFKSFEGVKERDEGRFVARAI